MHEGFRGVQFAREQMHHRARTEGERELGQRAGGAGKVDVAPRENLPAVVVPDVQRGDTNLP